MTSMLMEQLLQSNIPSMGSSQLEELKKLLRSMTPNELDTFNKTWRFWWNPAQKPPEGVWSSWLFLGGRGSGKTRAGSEWVRQKVMDGCRRIALIAPTAADARDVMIEGRSGLIECGWEHDKDASGNHMGRPTYEAGRRRVVWANGAIATSFSAEEPDRLRGPQHDALWADELAAWRKPRHVEAVGDAWSMAMFGLRIGSNPQAMISTTPRPIPLIREFLKSPMCKVTYATTYDNRANLADSFFNLIIAKYEGTRLGRQELRGELIEEMEGALWTRELVEHARSGFVAPLPAFGRVVVAVDPAVTDGAASNLTGIVVAALDYQGRGYLIADLSGLERRPGTKNLKMRDRNPIVYFQDSSVPFLDVQNAPPQSVSH
jgi:phage terminase large subunit-like protein